jgi:hypothetical protein
VTALKKGQSQENGYCIPLSSAEKTFFSGAIDSQTWLVEVTLWQIASPNSMVRCYYNTVRRYVQIAVAAYAKTRSVSYVFQEIPLRENA